LTNGRSLGFVFYFNGRNNRDFNLCGVFNREKKYKKFKIKT